MAGEITVRTSLTVRKGRQSYQSPSAGYTADLVAATAVGPTPGALAVSTEGTDVSLAQLNTPGHCFIQNIDSTNPFEWGVWDPETSRFYPVGQLLPGETVVLRLSPNVGVEYTGTGTGTTAATNRLHLKASGGASTARVEAFER